MTIVSADGQEVEPVAVDKLLIATAETYDIEVTLPSVGRYEFPLLTFLCGYFW